MSARVLVTGLDHPEGVAYDPEADVVWAGGEDGQLYRVPVETGVAEEVARAPGFVLGVAVDGRGRVVLCVSSNGSVCAWDGAHIQRVVAGLKFPNYPAFAPDGTLFVSDSGDWGGGNGRLMRVDVDGSCEPFSHAVPNFTNGCAVSPDGEWLWVVESYVPVLSRFELATGRREEIRRFDGTVLDGLAFTADGGLLIACYRPDRIYHLAESGAVEVVADDPQGTLLAAPTNVCFVGPSLDRVVAANLGRWHLTLLDIGLVGAPPHRPERWALDAVRVEVGG
ncbi:MAG TPA: SMP-30/gluconolactonase/LRE family protein [Solirubrobacteraceae bacterium]|nr:SMP-30/gluconolactonase/LRE family protein [Solirubrobacteraceae bacterium]